MLQGSPRPVSTSHSSSSLEVVREALTSSDLRSQRQQHCPSQIAHQQKQTTAHSTTSAMLISRQNTQNSMSGSFSSSKSTSENERSSGASHGSGLAPLIKVMVALKIVMFRGNTAALMSMAAAMMSSRTSPDLAVMMHPVLLAVVHLLYFCWQLVLSVPEYRSQSW